MNTSFIYAMPGIPRIIDRQKEPTPKEFIKNLHIDENMIRIPQQKFQRMWPIFAKVCETYNEDPINIYGKNGRRHRPSVEIRQLSMVLFRSELPVESYTQNVCASFFWLEHCSVIHSFKVVRNLRDTNRVFRELTHPLLKAIKL